MHFTRSAYEVLFGAPPEPGRSDEACAEAVMGEWDGRRFDADPELRTIGCRALQEIAECFAATDPVLAILAEGRLQELRD